jgi:hypothetical protein
MVDTFKVQRRVKGILCQSSLSFKMAYPRVPQLILLPYANFNEAGPGKRGPLPAQKDCYQSTRSPKPYVR